MPGKGCEPSRQSAGPILRASDFRRAQQAFCLVILILHYFQAYIEGIAVLCV